MNSNLTFQEDITVLYKIVIMYADYVHISY